MTTPRIPPLRIIESSPAPVIRQRAITPTPSKKPNHLLGILTVILAFATLIFGWISSEQIYPLFHLPVISELALVLTFPLILLGVVKLA
jgi:hypothetical protein